MSSTVLDAKEVYAAIQRGLPNIVTYLRTILKREKLSEEAESLRARYDAILASLEQGAFLNIMRRPSLTYEDDGGYFSGNRTRVSETHEQLRVPSISHSGYLLRRDDKYRWHRSWCRVESRDMKFYIYEDNNEEVLVKSFSVENTTPRFGSATIPDCDKENCFTIAGIGSSMGETPTSVAMTPEGEAMRSLTATSPQLCDEIYFAAYSDADLKQWRDALHMLTSGSRGSGRISLNILEGGSLLFPTTHDSASTSSSNFSSNRESMISTTSSLIANNRMSARSDTLDRDHPVTDEMKVMSLTKQQQPLPSPPPLHGQDDSIKPEDDDDNASGGTIYESIDNLVLQFDETMRETAQAMGQIGQSMKSGGKKRKKKDRSLFRQHSFLSSRKGSKSKLISEKKAELEKGERFSGHMFKKSSTGSWKKKWCVLKGSIFGYYKSSEVDSHGQEYVIVGADIRTYEDPKRSFTFSVMCKGVPEMSFSCEDEDTLLEWLSKLAAASADTEKSGFNEYLMALQAEEQAAMDDSKQYPDSIYRVPRPISMDGSVYDIPPVPRVGPPAPPLPSTISAEAAIESGLYSVPRALLNASEEGAQSLPPPPPNPFDIYDIPRASISPDLEDEEGIYDVPLDILDFEIYDYPPDVMELGLDPLDSGLDSTRNSTITVSSEFTVTPDRASSTISEDSWNTFSLPNSLRPSMAFSTFSMASSDDLQSPRTSMISMDMGSYSTFPRSNVSSEYIPSPMPPSEGSREMLAHGAMTPDIDSLGSGGEQIMEYGQCQMKGTLYKRERFMTWTKLYCTIRNNFLECHKSSGDHYTPALKLFLPGSEIKEGGGDAKKRWALQVKHPRRDGVLTFATDSRDNLDRWIRAFQTGSSIEVQPVHTVEQIRITDLDMQKKWSLEANALIDHTPSSSAMMDDFSTSTMPRRKTFSHQDEYQSDTLKRRRKFSWVKSNLMRRKGKKSSQGQEGAEQNRLSQMSFDIQGPTPDMLPPYTPDPMRKSMSLELLPSAPEVDETSGGATEAHTSVTSEGKEQFQGYLRVQRKGADSMWVRYWCLLEEKLMSCYISRRDFTLALSIPLKGSRINEAALECKREHSFKVWHIESGQCLFFAAENANELKKWFDHVTQGAEHTIPDNISVGSSSAPFVGFFYIPDDKKMADHSNSASHLNELAVRVDDRPAITVQCPSPSSVFYRGALKKQAHTGKWKDRFCIIRTGSLCLFHNTSEKNPIASIALHGCSLELISVPPGSEHQYIFKLNPGAEGGSSKSHTFAAPNETEMFAWVSALRDSSHEKAPAANRELKTQVSAEQNGTGSGGSSTGSPSLSGKNTLKRKSKKLKDANLVSYVPASSLKNSEHSGYIEIQFTSEPWMRYWCVSHSDNCLYIYEDQTSESTIKTICLPGYELKVIDPQVSKRPYTISINHPGISPVLLAANDQADLNMWLFVLERGTKAEFAAGKSSKKSANGSKVLLNESTNVKVLSHKVTSKSTAASKKKGPMKADHSIGTVKASEDGKASTEASKPENPQAQQDSIIRRYEKRIRKTRKVANQTEERLKQQQTALLHFKKELSRHISKLTELADGGDRQATKRLKSIKLKLQQLDKIVPYLGKYIAVNRQAEMQTVAVLKESCTMELRSITRSPSKEGVKASPRGHRGTSPLAKIVKTEGIKEENENAEQDEATSEPNTAESAGVGLTTVEEDHTYNSGSEEVATPKAVIAEENPYASLSEVRKQAEVVCVAPTSNYAQLHFTQSGGAARVRPPSVNYSEVKICHNGGRNAILTPDSVEQAYQEDRLMDQQHPTILEEESQDCHDNHIGGEDPSMQDVTLTPESAAAAEVSSAASKPSHSPRRPSSPVPPPSHPAPPPPQDDSPIHASSFSQEPPVSPIAHSKENGQVDNDAIDGISSPSTATVHSSTPEASDVKRANSKAKSPPPPVAKKPSSKQSTPVHKANNCNHSTPTSHNGLEDCEVSTAALSNEQLNLSPSHKDMMNVMGSAPRLADRIKALQQK